MTGQRLFISHANEDSAVADRIVSYLEARGMPCWISSRDIPPRAIYADAITEAMQACSACAVIVSAASNASKAVKRELELASHYDKPFIPIRIDATEPATGVDYYLRNTQWLDFKRNGERALDRIVGQTADAVAAASRAPAPPATRATPAKRSITPLIALAASIAIGVVAWISWTQVNRSEAGPQSSFDWVDLVGAYNWEGLACFSGPIVTEDDDILVFTMTGAPTFRHEVLSATLDDEEFRVETRVIEPAAQAGANYSLVTHAGSSEMLVTTGGTTNTWTRCANRDQLLGAIDREIERRSNRK